MIRLTQALVFVVCLGQGMAWTQTDRPAPLSADVTSVATFYPFGHIDGSRNVFSQPTTRTFSIDFGPKLVELKALYLEKPQDHATLSAETVKSHNYFDLLATSSGFGGKLIGEAELAYGTLSSSTLVDQRPLMSRLGLKGSWDKVGYGLLYRSFGSGFVSMTGTKVDHPRDERQLWGEYDFGYFRLRATAGESWETNSDTNSLTFTRTAATSLQLSKPGWSALLSSSYSLAEQAEDSGQQTRAFTNALSIAYRPTGFLTIEPGVTVKEERDQITGLKTDTPSAAIALVFTPYRDLQLTSRASYARGLSDERFKETAILNTAAALNWKLGKSFFGEQFLSVQIEYRDEFHPGSPTNSPPNLSGMIQWKMVRF